MDLVSISPGFAEDGTLFAGTETSGLFRSVDRGHTWQRVGQGAVSNAVNVILLSPEFPAKPDLLLMVDSALLVSRDGGESWSEWGTGGPAEQVAVCVIAPDGLDPGSSLLVGLADGTVARL